MVDCGMNKKLLVLFLTLSWLAGCATWQQKPENPPQGLVLKWEPGIPPNRLGGYVMVKGYKLFVWLDTGAYTSFYYHLRKSEKFLSVLGKPLSVTPEVENFPYFRNNPQHVKRYRFAKLPLPGFSVEPFVVDDVSGYIDLSSRDTPTEGLVLGTRGFEDSWLVWNAQNLTLTVYPRGSSFKIPKGWRPIPAAIVSRAGLLFLKAKQNGKPFWLFFDSGAPNAFPYVNEAKASTWLVEGRYSRFSTGFGELQVGSDFAWGGENLHHPLVYINTMMPLGNARVGFPWLSGCDWAVYYSDHVQFYAKIPAHWARAHTSMFPFGVTLKMTPSGWRLFVEGLVGSSQGNFAPQLPAINTEIEKVDGKVVAGKDWPWVNQAMMFDNKITLTWQQGHQQHTETFTRSIRAKSS